MPKLRPPIIELRQYVVAPGKRDSMIDLFDCVFAEAQDQLGLPILGHFRDIHDPDRLVWLRGFPDLASRPERLGAFYGGSVWAEYGPEAIGYVKGFDNVQLLREAKPGSGIEVDPRARPALNATVKGSPILATTYPLLAPPDAELVALCETMLRPLNVLGTYVTLPGENNFPALPIRQNEHLFTWFAAGNGAAEPDEQALAPFLAGPAERLTLEPCGRSLLR